MKHLTTCLVILPRCAETDYSFLVKYIPDMIDKVFLSGEVLAAVSAGVRRRPGVLTDVIVQVLLPRERARADRALVRRFTRVLSAQQSTFRFE